MVRVWEEGDGEGVGGGRDSEGVGGGGDGEVWEGEMVRCGRRGR